MTTLSIRKATEADLPSLLALYGQPSFNDGRVISLDEAKAIFSRMSLYPDFAAYVAERDGEVVGTFSLMIVDNLAHWGTPTALVENVVVAEGRQGGGIGREMMREAFRMAEAKGAYKVALSSGFKNEKAHAFYESLGFEKHGFSFRLEPSLASPSPLAGEGGVGDPTIRHATSQSPAHPAQPGSPSPTLPRKEGESRAAFDREASAS